MSAIEVRFHRAVVAALEPMRLVARIDDFHAQFVAEYSRIGKERLAPVKSVKIGPAYSDAMNAHESFAGALPGLGSICLGQASRSFEYDLLHALTL
jgi:hypothetical protein